MEKRLNIEEMLNQNPLVAFSLYTDIQCRTLQILGEEILACLDAGIEPDGGTGRGTICNGEVIDRGYGQFWLWVLGTYEVVRTMCQAEQCFSQPVADNLRALKRRLADLRIPFAKQGLRGKRVPVHAEPSIYGIVDSPPDLHFEEKGQVISARELIGEFAVVMGSIMRGDVLADHRTTYSNDAHV